MFCGSNHFQCDPELFILIIAIKLLMRMENKIYGSGLILLKIMVMFPLTSEGSETSALWDFFFRDWKEECLQMSCVTLSSAGNTALGTAVP